MALELWLAVVQGGYYVLTGLWPVLSMRTFMAVTGPKTDTWLVRMVGLLAASIGIPLLLAVWLGGVDRGLVLVALLSAVAFLVIDVYYVWRRVIGKIYLLDALLEVPLIALWSVVLLR